MKVYLFFLGLLTLAACYQEPEFPVEPQINFERVRFIENKSTTSFNDTLKFTISFKDGDGDLGVLPNDNQPALITHFNNQFIFFGDSDTLPDLNCRQYIGGYVANNGDFVYRPDSVVKHLYVKQNPRYYNIFLDLYTVRNGEEVFYDPIEIGYPNCGISFNGRFKINPTDDPMPLSGSITYNLPGLFLPVFNNDSLKVKLRITDRAGNSSNLVESPVFTLRGVQTNR